VVLGKCPSRARSWPRQRPTSRRHFGQGGGRALLVVDLDDTLWGGIVGDVGEGLRLGGHDGMGEAFVDFQRAVKNLKRRG
jgi:hypothetical protein